MCYNKPCYKEVVVYFHSSSDFNFLAVKIKANTVVTSRGSNNGQCQQDMFVKHEHVPNEGQGHRSIFVCVCE